MQPSKKYQPQDYNVHRNRERELEDKLEEHERELRDLCRRKSGIPIMHLSVERFLQNNRRVPGVSHFYIFLSLDPIMMVYSVSINGNMEYYSMEQQLNHTSMLTQYLLKMMIYVVE